MVSLISIDIRPHMVKILCFCAWVAVVASGWGSVVETENMAIVIASAMVS